MRNRNIIKRNKYIKLRKFAVEKKIIAQYHLRNKEILTNREKVFSFFFHMNKCFLQHFKVDTNHEFYATAPLPPVQIFVES